jgi:hypothetical protein
MRLPLRAIRDLIAIPCAAFLLAAAAAVAQDPPVVHFAEDQISADETDGEVMIPVVISEPPTEGLISVYIVLTAGTASVGEDFVGGTTICYFHPADGDTSHASVQLFDDLIEEDPETLHLEITPSPVYTIGDPATTTLTILDDDTAGPEAWFEVDGEVPGNLYGGLVLTGEPGTERMVDLVIDELPPGGATVYYADDRDGSLHAVPFVDQTRVTLTVTLPDVGASAYHEVATLSIVGVEGGLARQTSATDLAMAAFDSGALLGDGDCAVCLLLYYFHVASWSDCYASNAFFGCGFDCEEFGGRSGGTKTARDVPDLDVEAALTTLRRYRDEVLLAENNGADYVALYDEHGVEAVLTLLTDPELMQQAFLTAESWVPAIDAVVEGQGDAMTVTAEMQHRLTGLLDGLVAAGSGALGDVLTGLREGLALDQVAGATPGDLQDRVAANVRTQAASWTEIRAMFD